LWEKLGKLGLATRERVGDEPNPVLPVTDGNVRSVAFSPDGKTLAAGFGGIGVEGGVVHWDVAAQKRLVDGPLPVNERGVGSVAFSPEGKTLAAGFAGLGGVAGVVLWDVDLDSWQRRAGQIANRNFTLEEWRKYFPERPYHATFPDLPVPPEVTPN
jgi:WD40 repeat protein